MCTSKTYMKDVNNELSITYSSSETQLQVYFESLSLASFLLYLSTLSKYHKP